jgi:hypothetical protein
LDKSPWEEVRAEMVDEKGLPPDVADAIQKYVALRGAPHELLARLQSDAELRFAENADAKVGSTWLFSCADCPGFPFEVTPNSALEGFVLFVCGEGGW